MCKTFAGSLVVLLVGLLIVMFLPAGIPAQAQGGPGTRDFAIRDFGACINLPDFTVADEPDPYNTVYEVPGLFSINFAEYLMPLETLPASGDELYAAMIALLDTVQAGDYVRVSFEHPQYLSAAVAFTLDERRMFGMIYRNQDDALFFLFADEAPGFDMLAIGRAIFAADRRCRPLDISLNSAQAPATTSNPGSTSSQPVPPAPSGGGWPAFCDLPCSQITCDQARQCGGHPARDHDGDGRACESQCW